MEKTVEIKNAKQTYLKQSVQTAEAELEKLEKEKKDLDKTYCKILKIEKLTKELKEKQDYKTWKKEQGERINESIKELKENIETEAENLFKNDSRFNYPIFMAIAETIGFDATGRETEKNDLDEIAVELQKFLKE
jgi:type I restriction enzyme M protein